MIWHDVIEEDFQNQSNTQPANNGTGFMSTVHLTYDGQNFEFSTSEPESNKKKAEHKAADICIKALEVKYREQIRPNEQKKSSLAQVCGYGLTDEKNLDSIELFNSILDEEIFLPLGALLFIKNIRTAVNKQVYDKNMNYVNTLHFKTCNAFTFHKYIHLHPHYINSYMYTQ